MKYKLEITINDDDSIEFAIQNPAEISTWTVVGLLEKIKTEVILATPSPESREES